MSFRPGRNVSAPAVSRQVNTDLSSVARGLRDGIFTTSIPAPDSTALDASVNLSRSENRIRLVTCKSSELSGGA